MRENSEILRNVDRRVIGAVLLAALAVRVLVIAMVRSSLNSVILEPTAGTGTAFFFIGQVILGTLAVLIIWYTAGRIHSARAGLIAAITAACYPDFLIYCISPDAKNLSVFLIVVLMAALVSDLDDRKKAALSGLATGMGCIFEPLFLLLVPGTLLANRKKLLYAVVLATILVSWTVRGVLDTDGPVTLKGRLTLSAFTEAGDIWDTAGNIYDNASALMRKGWEDKDGAVPAGVARNAGYTAGYAYVLVTVMGIIGLLCRRGIKHRLYITQVILFVFSLLMLTLIGPPHRALVEPLMIISASVLVAGVKTRPIPFSS